MQTRLAIKETRIKKPGAGFEIIQHKMHIRFQLNKETEF